MPETNSQPCQISNMMRHIENPDIVRTVYSGIFRHINPIHSQCTLSLPQQLVKGCIGNEWVKGHSAILSHVQAY